MTDFGRKAGLGDMLKSVYDTNDDGVVDAIPVHKTSHQDGGSDEITVQRLDGLLLYAQTPIAHVIAGAKHTASFLYQLNALIFDANLDDSASSRTPSAHKTSHQDGGSDEISVAALSGQLADDQPSKAHALGGAKHNSATLAQLNAKVSDATLDDSASSRKPLAHKTRHQDGGTDEIDATGLVGRTNFVDRGDPSAFDYTLSYFTTDGNLHDIDFSSIIPAGAVAAYLLIQIQDNIVGSVLYLIKKGNTYPYNRLMLRTQVANETVSLDGFVSIDANRKAQYLADNTTYNRIDVCVRGWLI